MSEKTMCPYCGRALDEDNAMEFNGQQMCDDCYDELTTTCDCCGVRVWRESVEGNSSTLLCSECYSDHYTTCEACGRLIHNDAAHYYDDTGYAYCSRCFNEMISKPIKAYTYKPDPIFYGSGNFYMGVELEIDEGGEYDENAEILCDMANRGGIKIYCKHDGSLNEGVEIVSHPMTLDYHLNEMNWQEIFKKAIDMGYCSHYTDTCGLHIHVNRTVFGGDYDTQEESIARVIHFIELHWNEVLRFSRRTESNMNRWASRYGIHTTAQDTYKNAKNKRMGRYVAVNLENMETIEFRLFRGTLRYDTFVATLQLIDEICHLAINLSDKQIEGMSWSEFVMRIDPSKKQLIDYLKSKRLYVNESVTAMEEM